MDNPLVDLLSAHWRKGTNWKNRFRLLRWWIWIWQSTWQAKDLLTTARAN